MLNSLPAVITLLVALSMATERAVEIVKSLVPWLDLVRPEPVSEGRRRAAIQALAVGFGVVITYLAWPVVAQVMAASAPKPSTVAALGLLASGGSAFWNSLLGIVLNLKVEKGAEARAAVESVATRSAVLPNPAEGVVG